MGRFIVTYRISGEATRELQADSREDADRLVAAELRRDDFEIEPDESEVDDYSVQELHPVTRDGVKMWTTYRRSSDVAGHEDPTP